MPAVNEIYAPLGNRMETTTATVFQYNSGMMLRPIGPELPDTYRVDFANSVSGQSKSMLGGADGVLIPYEYFVPGSYIHAWIVLVGEDYAVTRYHITIPISPRAMPTEEQPSPEQESIINQTIAALNDGVERAETAADNAEVAASHYPRINNGYWEIWDAQTGAYVSTGVQAQGPQGEPGTSPEISIAPISGGHRITITDVDGTKTVDVMDGENGVGISSIVKTGTSGLVDTYTITYTDGNATTFAVTNGEDGAPGVSPVITVTDITGGHRVTIADAEHPQGQSFDVMDGAGSLHVVGYEYIDDGVPQLIDATYDDIRTWLYANEIVVLFSPPMGESYYPAYTDRGLIAFRNIGGKEFHVYSNNTCQIIDDEYVTESGLDDALAGMPMDVQVNGVSVLQDGVANVPVANNNTYGVAKVKTEDGVQVDANGYLRTTSASLAQVKGGTEYKRVIVPDTQHYSAFYGLAKAAGADMKNLTGDTVGVYPEAQKSAISQMLNGPVTVSGTTPTITALPGVRYVCGEVATLDITLPASGCVDVVFESGSTATVLTITPPSGVTVKWENGFDPTALEANTTYEINIADGLGVAGVWT